MFICIFQPNASYGSHIILSKEGNKKQINPPQKKIRLAFRLACRSPHCRFDGDFCTTAQAPLAAEERPSGEQCQANKLFRFADGGNPQTVDFYST